MLGCYESASRMTRTPAYHLFLSCAVTPGHFSASTCNAVSNYQQQKTSAFAGSCHYLMFLLPYRGVCVSTITIRNPAPSKPQQVPYIHLQVLHKLQYGHSQCPAAPRVPTVGVGRASQAGGAGQGACWGTCSARQWCDSPPSGVPEGAKQVVSRMLRIRRSLRILA